MRGPPGVMLYGCETATTSAFSVANGPLGTYRQQRE